MNKIIWVGILVIRDKKVLMVKEKGTDFLKFPGGGADDGESPEQTLLRELDEELGVAPLNHKKYVEVDLPGRAEGVIIHFIVYVGEVEGEFDMDRDVSEVCWIDSNYERDGFDIGHLASKVVIPKLHDEGLIG